MAINNTWFMKGYHAGQSGRYSDMYDGWAKAKGKPDRTKNLGKYIDAQEFFYEGFLDGERNPKKNPSETTDWIPVHAIRRLPDGSIQLLTEKGTMSNPGKRKSFLGKVRKLFSNPGRKVRVWEVVDRTGKVVKVLRSKSAANKYQYRINTDARLQGYFIRETSYFG